MNYHFIVRFAKSLLSFVSAIRKNPSLSIVLILALLYLADIPVNAASGDLDTSFGSAGKVVTPVGFNSDFAQSVILQPDGKIVVAGYTQNDFAVVRYNPNGTLDTGFGAGGTGKVITPIGSGTADEAYAVALQSDGKIVVAGFTFNSGTYDFAIVRYLTNGTLDASFGTGGKVITQIGTGDELAEAIAVQPDGKLLVAGTADLNLSNSKFAVVRYNTDGTLDTSFGTNGKAIFSVGDSGGLARTVALQPDGKILLGGDSFVNVGQSALTKFTLVRFTPTGTVDTAFGTNGKVVTSISENRYGTISDLALQPDGKIIASGNDSGNTDGNTAVVRYQPNGALDPSFGVGGIVTTRVGLTSSTGEAVAIQANGKIVAAGDSRSGNNTDFGVVQLNTDGSIDTSFGNSGKVITAIGSRHDRVRDAAIQLDGKIVVIGHSEDVDAGFFEDFAVVRYIGLPVAARPAPFDFDGDSKTDISIFRPSGGEWWINLSVTNQTVAAQFGVSGDKPVPADFTGDGKTDIAFWRASSGQWFILRSDNSSFYAFPFGANGDIPAPADYDGDGKADAAVFRPSNAAWYILRSSDGQVSISQFGISEDKPVAADYDGDSKADIAVFRPSVAEWWILKSTGGIKAVQFGSLGDKAVAGDYTGDGKADIAFWRPSNGFWYILRSENDSYYGFPFGSSGDAPIPGDYDGDGKFDAAVFRSSNSGWYLNRSTAGFYGVQFGLSGDQPIPNSFVR